MSSGPHIGICMNCKKETIYRYKSWIKDYCSQSCSNAANWQHRKKADLKTYNCTQCFALFTRLAYQVTARERSGRSVQFCSRACADSSRAKSTSACASCGQEVKRAAGKMRDRVFCSRKCFGVSRRTPGAIWSAINPDRAGRRVYMRAYIEKHRVQKNLLSSSWAKRNRSYRKYIANLRRSAGRITFDEWAAVITEAKGSCRVCSSSDRLQVDHIVPVARGGKTERANLQVLCKFCNTSKGAKPFHQWLPGRLRELHVHGIEIQEIRS